MIARILVAGASGTLGREVVACLKAREFWVRATGRDPKRLATLAVDETVPADLTRPQSLRGCCDGIDAVISCAGASMKLGGFSDRHSFTKVDFRGNANLLAEAKSARIGRFVYVSLFGTELLGHTEYARAHEQFVALLRGSGLAYTIVRPTGYFGFLSDIFRMAQKGRGRGIVIGNGEAASNPISEQDVAEVCVDSLTCSEVDLPIGGPDVFTRREIVELTFDVLNKKPRIRRVPAWLFKMGVSPLALLNPRLHALCRFGAAVSVTDFVAPAGGTRHLRDYFASLAET